MTKYVGQAFDWFYTVSIIIYYNVAWSHHDNWKCARDEAPAIVFNERKSYLFNFKLLGKKIIRKIIIVGKC